MTVHVVFVPDTGMILGVIADPSSLERTVRAYFDAEETAVRDDPDAEAGECWFVWESFEVDPDGEWDVTAVCGKHPDETEPGPWQMGTMTAWDIT